MGLGKLNSGISESIQWEKMFFENCVSLTLGNTAHWNRS